MRKRLDSSSEWKMLASCSGYLKYISSYSDYYENYSFRAELLVLELKPLLSKASIFYCRFFRYYSVS